MSGKQRKKQKRRRKPSKPKEQRKMAFDLKQFMTDNPGILPEDVETAIRSLPKAAQPDEQPPEPAVPTAPPEPETPATPESPDPVFEFYAAIQQLEFTGQTFHMLSQALRNQVPLLDGSAAMNKALVKQCLDTAITALSASAPALNAAKKAIE